MSETFLIIWATLATILAVYFHHTRGVLMDMINTHRVALLMIAKGKASVSIKDNVVQVKELEEGV